MGPDPVGITVTSSLQIGAPKFDRPVTAHFQVTHGPCRVSKFMQLSRLPGEHDIFEAREFFRLRQLSSIGLAA